MSIPWSMVCYTKSSDREESFAPYFTKKKALKRVRIALVPSLVVLPMKGRRSGGYGAATLGTMLMGTKDGRQRG